jgi:hypothetical protein
MAGTGSVIMELLTLRDQGRSCACHPSRVAEPLWVQFAALLPPALAYDLDHPLDCHRPPAP